MKREEFFEALSDIDENMVAAAGESEQAVKPVTVAVNRKSRVKPLCAVAACVALAVTVTAVAVNLNRPSKLPVAPVAPIAENHEYKTVVNVINGSKYPENLYSPSFDYSKLEMKYMGDEYPNYPNPSKFRSYDELAEYSQLVVMGTFTNDGGQVAQTYELPDFSQAMKGDYFNRYISFNVLKVEKVLKSNGKVWAGDEIIITQPYSVYTHSIDEYPPNDGSGTMYSFSQSTPMIKGDKWIYFLTENGSGYPEIFGDQSYSAVNDYEGRYPVPGEENAAFEYRENVNGVVAPAVFNQGIYNELGEKLAAAEQSERPTYVLEYEKVISPFDPLGYEKNGYPTGLNIEFELEEFEGVTFGWNDGILYTRVGGSEERKTAVGGTGVYSTPCNTYLCDITGDGRREICSAFSIGSGIVHNYVWIWDYFNDKLYVLNLNKWGEGETDFSLEKKDGELYLLSWDDPYESRKVSEELLTLDMLTEIDLNAQQTEETEKTHETDQSPKNVIKIMDIKNGHSDHLTDMALKFDMKEFPDVSFERSPTRDHYGLYYDALYLKGGEKSRRLFACERINSIYLCDLNGDGNREICAAIDVKAWNFSGPHNIICPSIAVIDYANNKSYLLFDQSKDINYDYTLEVIDDILLFGKYERKTGASAISSEPLTLDILKQEGQIIDDIEIPIVIDE